MRDFQRFRKIKSILIHEYQHKSTHVNTNQDESNVSQHKSTQVWYESTRVQHESDANKFEFKTSLDDKK